MRQAHVLAQQARSLCLPNPAVGCVLTDSAGEILGQGHTQRAGGPHAEIMALRDAAATGKSVVGCTAYVTLEPCSHHGRTPPCCDAIISAGIKKVVASIADPNPLVAGQGFARLRAAGIEVEVGPGAAESRELNIGFFSRMVRKTPWVRTKIAASLDGQTALLNGQSQWITGEQARADGHAWRARSCAVLTGIGTVLADNPRLDVRSVQTSRQPHVVIVDSKLETPLNAHVLGAARQRYIYAAARNDDKKSALEVDAPEHPCPLPSPDAPRGANFLYRTSQVAGNCLKRAAKRTGRHPCQCPPHGGGRGGAARSKNARASSKGAVGFPHSQTVLTRRSRKNNSTDPDISL